MRVSIRTRMRSAQADLAVRHASSRHDGAREISGQTMSTIHSTIDPGAARRNYRGPALFSAGFRPFFLVGALYAAIVGLSWLPVFSGHVGLHSHFAPVDWHAHEMIFGAAAAMIAGFLLTAIPNWTGRLPLRGTPLAVLVAAWLLGRLAVSFGLGLPAALAAGLDLAFPVLLVGAAAREIIAGKNWRNLRVVAPLVLLIAANVLHHWLNATQGDTGPARRLGIAAILTLIMLIGGRIIPSFTRNWLVRENPGRLPVPFSTFDAAAMALGVAGLLMWAIAPLSTASGVVLLAAGGLHVARLVRWAGDRTMRDPIVLVLHVGYMFVPAGFVLCGLAALSAHVPPSAGIHAWTVGAIGTMTLAVMSRATLGHTGQELKAGGLLQAAYALIVLAAIIRIVASFVGFNPTGLYHASAGLWALAYLAFAMGCAPLMLRRRGG